MDPLVVLLIALIIFIFFKELKKKRLKIFMGVVLCSALLAIAIKYF